MWRRVEVYINNRDVSSSNGNYAYTAYFQNQFATDAKEKEIPLEAEIFYEDSPGAFDSVDPDENIGFKHRMALVNNSSIITAYGKLKID